MRCRRATLVPVQGRRDFEALCGTRGDSKGAGADRARRQRTGGVSAAATDGTVFENAGFHPALRTNIRQEHYPLGEHQHAGEEALVDEGRLTDEDLFPVIENSLHVDPSSLQFLQQTLPFFAPSERLSVGPLDPLSIRLFVQHIHHLG